MQSLGQEWVFPILVITVDIYYNLRVGVRVLLLTAMTE